MCDEISQRPLIDLISVKYRYNSRLRPIVAAITNPILIAVENSMTNEEVENWMDDYSDFDNGNYRFGTASVR